EVGGFGKKVFRTSGLDESLRKTLPLNEHEYRVIAVVFFAGADLEMVIEDEQLLILISAFEDIESITIFTVREVAEKIPAHDKPIIRAGRKFRERQFISQCLHGP